MKTVIAALLLTVAAAAPLRAADETALRKSADVLLTLSDEDYRDLAKTRAGRDAQWASLERPALLSTIYLSLAASRYRAALQDGLDPALKAEARTALGSLTTAGRTISDDARAATPDADLLQQTGWWGSFNDYVNSDPASAPSPPCAADASSPPGRTRRSRTCSPPSTRATRSSRTTP